MHTPLAGAPASVIVPVPAVPYADRKAFSYIADDPSAANVIAVETPSSFIMQNVKLATGTGTVTVHAPVQIAYPPVADKDNAPEPITGAAREEPPIAFQSAATVHPAEFLHPYRAAVDGTMQRD